MAKFRIELVTSSTKVRISQLSTAVLLLLSACGGKSTSGPALVIPDGPCRHFPASFKPPTPEPNPEFTAIPSAEFHAAQRNSPWLFPPSRHPHYISRQRAIQLAEGTPSQLMNGSTLHPRVTARLMTIIPFDRLLGEGIDMITNRQRKLWIVTVHTRTVDTEGPRPHVYFVHTVVIDAESGISFQYAAGCDPFR